MSGRSGSIHTGHRRRTVRILLLWGLLLLGGFGYLMVYSNSPGEFRETPPHWETSSEILRQVGQPTLLMFVHPRCPCTRASVGELARIVARHPDDVDVHVVVIRPEGLPVGWEQGELLRDAGAIPGVNIEVDPLGVEALRFHATTSGHTLLYDANGDLLFSGGITAARGHAGDSAGEEAILRWLEHTGDAARTAPVFGCGLFGPTACRNGGMPTCHN